MKEPLAGPDGGKTWRKPSRPIPHPSGSDSIFLAAGSAAAFAEEAGERLPAARHMAIDSGISAEERAAVLASGISGLLPRNPSLAELARPLPHDFPDEPIQAH